MTAGNSDLKPYLVDKAPPSIFYIPNFINEDEEKLLLERVYSVPKPKWTNLSHRRLQNWGGLPHPKGMIAEPLPSWLQLYVEKVFKLGIFQDKMPNHILVNEYLPGQGIMPHEDGLLFFPVVSTISLGSHTLLDFFHHIDRKSLAPDQCKNDIIVPSPLNTEEDSEMEDKEAHQKQLYDERHFTSILLERRSLILVCDEMYKLHLHGIGEKTEDTVTKKVANLQSVPFSEGDTLERKTRVSLTIRHVPKVFKAKLLFGKR